MITVRFPNGQAIQYNTANYLRYTSSSYELYTADPDKRGAWVASIQLSAGAVVESVPACRVYDASRSIDEDSVAQITRELRYSKINAWVNTPKEPDLPICPECGEEVVIHEIGTQMFEIDRCDKCGRYDSETYSSMQEARESLTNEGWSKET